MTVQFLTAAAYPTITVELGVADLASLGGTWGASLWDTGTWTEDIAWTDVSSYVRNLSTSWNRNRELNRQPSAVLSMSLDNRDGRFSPGNLGALAPFVSGGVSKIRPRIAVRVQATWSAVTYPVYYGFVSSWSDVLPAMGKDLEAQVRATDALSLLALNTLDGSTIGSNGDTCATRIRSILTAAAWPNTSMLDPGTSTLKVDSTNDSALTLLQDVAQSDGGQLFADRDGVLTYHGRNRRSGGVIGTSLSSVFVGTGSKTWTTQALLPIEIGDTVWARGVVDDWKWMKVTVTAYSGTTLTGTVQGGGAGVSYNGGGFTPTSWNLYLVRSTTAQVTFGPSNSAYDEPVLSNDDTNFYNKVVVTPDGGAAQTATDSDSVSVYSTRTLSVAAWCQDSEAAALATFLLSVVAEPEYRCESVRVTPAVSPSVLWPLVLDARINDLHSVIVPLPITTYSSTMTKAVHVAGISHQISTQDGWRVTFGYSSATPY